MKHYFLDTSALVKLFVSEEGADQVRRIVRWGRGGSAGVQVVVCDLAYPECVAALRQLLQRGLGGRRGISHAALRRTMPELHTLFEERESLFVVETSKVVTESAHLAARHHVKGADAVHIAAARSVSDAVPAGDEFWFVTADTRQSNAARDEGMAVLDPTS